VLLSITIGNPEVLGSQQQSTNKKSKSKSAGNPAQHLLQKIQKRHNQKVCCTRHPSRCNSAASCSRCTRWNFCTRTGSDQLLFPATSTCCGHNVSSTNWHNAVRCMSAAALPSPEGTTAASSCRNSKGLCVTVNVLLLPWKGWGVAQGSFFASP
jgi:hypothetical protein